MIPIVITLGIFALMAQGQPGAGRRTSASRTTFAILQGTRLLAVLPASTASPSAASSGLASYLAIFFRDQYDIIEGAAPATCTALCVFAGSFARPIGGLLADRFGGIRVLLALLRRHRRRCCWP